MAKTSKMLVRIASLALAVITALSAGVVLASAEETLYVAKANNNNNANYSVKADAPIGYRFKIKGAFAAYEVQIPTYNTSQNGISVSLYKWDTNLEKTVSGTVLHTEKLENCQDWTWHKFDLSEIAPAGEYLVYVHDPVIIENKNKHNIGVYAADNNTQGMGCMYINGVETKADMAVKLHMIEDISNPFEDIITFQDVSPDNSAGVLDYWDVGDESKILGQRVKVSAPIIGFAFSMPTWGNTGCSIKLSAYKWNETFEKTVAGTPLATGTLNDIKDNSINWLVFDNAIPADEYLFTVEKLSGLRVAVRFRTTNASGGYAYVDGAEFMNDLSFTVRFESKLNGQAPFIACDGEDDLSDGNVTLPEQWKPAEDSLLNTHKVQPTTWVFTDGLGRESWEYGENGVGAVNEDKVLAMFYWNWHLRCTNSQQPFNLQDMLDKYPEAKNDWEHEIWNNSVYLHYWNEPIYGYYSTTDTWVLRRHAELLANAGVDTVFTDNSNMHWTYRNGYVAMYEQWTEAQNDGVNAPKVSFLLPFWYTDDTENDLYTMEQMEYLYADIYRRGQYENLWFWFEGKPMLMANKAWIEDSTNPVYKEMLEFFTFRRGVPSYIDNENRQAQERVEDWGWLATYPQATYYAKRQHVSSNKVEQMTVGVAQNFNYETNSLSASNAGYMVMGRSYSSDNQTRFKDAVTTEYPLRADTSKWGYNFAEQWNYALEVDPKVVFVTGYNEWTVTRYQSWKGTENSFNDLYNDEYSRDIEPTKGALKDHYYYQLINYTRKFKGAEEMPVPTAKATIDLSKGLEAQWESVGPYFAAYIGNTMNRDSYGRVGSTPYRDFSARNDVIGAQIARDDEYVYFNVECNEDITPYTDKLWMNLYIDVDQTNKGWETFDFVVNKTAASAKTSVLEKFTDGYTSEKVADVEYKVEGKFMTIKIAKSDLGISGDDFTINFAWTDTVHDADDKGANSKNGWVYSDFSGDIMDFYTSGEVAPGARFKFSYISTAENAGTLPDVGGDESTTETTTPSAPETSTPAETTTQAPEVSTPEESTTKVPTESTTKTPETSTPAETTTVAPETTGAPSPETTTKAPETTTEAAGGCGGCGSTVIGSAAAVAVIAMASAAAVVLKKKED